MSALRHRSSRREMRALLEVAGARPVAASTRLDVSAPTVRATNGESAGAAHLPSRSELRALLEIAGSRPTPAPSPMFVATTEALLLDVPADAITFESRGRRERRARTPAALTGAAAAVVTLVLVGALAGLYGGGSDTASALSLGESVDTTVVLPDGTTVDARRGLALPEGTVIRTGPSGRAVVDGVEVGPGLELVVSSGRLQRRDDADVTGTPTEPTTGGPAAGGSPGGAGTPAGPPTGAVPEPGVTNLPTAGPDQLPATTVPTLPVPSTLLPQLTLPTLLPGG